MKQRGEKNKARNSFDPLAVLIAILGPVLYLAVFHLNVIICFARHKAYFIIFAYQQPIRSAAKAINLRGLNRIPSSSKLTLVMPIPCP